MLEPNSSPLLVAALVGLLGLAVATDIDQRKISNKLVVVGLAIGLVGHAWLGGFAALVLAFAGVLVGFLCLLPFYAAGGMGAGDVKLMAMCGAFLGPVYAFVAVVASLVVGGILGFAWFFWYLNVPEDESPKATEGGALAMSPGNPGKGARSAIPFAVAIGAGTLLTLFSAPYLIKALA
jgi:prepilin peptidase CpaA